MLQFLRRLASIGRQVKRRCRPAAFRLADSPAEARPSWQAVVWHAGKSVGNCSMSTGEGGYVCVWGGGVLDPRCCWYREWCMWRVVVLGTVWLCYDALFLLVLLCMCVSPFTPTCPFLSLPGGPFFDSPVVWLSPNSRRVCWLLTTNFPVADFPSCDCNFH